MKTPLLSFAASAMLVLSAPAAIVINPGESLTFFFDNLQEYSDGGIFNPAGGKIFARPAFPPLFPQSENPSATIWEDRIGEPPTAQSNLNTFSGHFNFPDTMLQDGDGIVVIKAGNSPVTFDSLTLSVPIPGTQGHYLAQSVIPEACTGTLLSAAGLCLLGQRRRVA